MSNDVVISDGFDEDDPNASPFRGTAFRFKDGNYYTMGDEIDVKGKTYVVLDRRTGWQKLEEGCPPEYLLWNAGERAPRPDVPKEDWPLNLNGQPEHPWRLTNYLYLLDTASGEFLTFWTSTTGGSRAIGELSGQIKEMRKIYADAIPVIELQSRMMPTQFGADKPRPHFQITTWKMRNREGGGLVELPDGSPQKQLENFNNAPKTVDATPEKKVTKASVTRITTKDASGKKNDPDFNDTIPY